MQIVILIIVMDDRLIWVALNLLRGNKHGEKLITIALNQYKNGSGITVPLSSKVYSDAEKEIKNAEKEDIEVLTINSQKYPKRLGDIKDPPIVLYMRGDIIDDDENAISIVGSRKCSSYGRMIAEAFSNEIASAGITVVSGLAEGIDTLSHRGALAASGRTIAVLGSGIDCIYPSSNKSLAKKIIKSGALLSEFPLGTAPHKYNFPFRNRIISGLSIATLVVEAAEHSGSLITARLAAEQGRDVFAIPGDITSDKSRGANRLIQDGVVPVTCVADILEYIGYKIEIDTKKKKRLSDEENLILDVLNNDAKTVESIAYETAISPSRLASILTHMEIKQLIKRTAGRFRKSL
ncbi:MAG: DNA-processing protein DprA [Caldisericota bacterium]|nr:DNA-processing protein DprA [Caldisericota bacterium]